MFPTTSADPNLLPWVLGAMVLGIFVLGIIIWALIRGKS